MSNISKRHTHAAPKPGSKEHKQAIIAQAIERDPSLARNRYSKNWIINLVTVVFVCVGIGIFIYPLIINYVNYRQQAQAIGVYEEKVAQLSPKQIKKMWSDAIQYNIDLGTPTLKDPFKYRGVAPPLDRYERTLNVDEKGMMAYIDAPKIHMKQPIYHGTSDQVLLEGGGHIVTTQLPTTQASVHPVLTGHTGAVGHIFFDNITQLQDGDIFQLTVLNRHMSYQVDQIKIIEPTDTSDIQPELGENWVTLLTCYPYGVNNKRYLVRAKYIGDNVAPTVSPGVPIWVLWALLITLLIAGIIVWFLLARRREFTQELNARKVAQENDSESESSRKTDHQDLSAESDASSEVGPAPPTERQTQAQDSVSKLSAWRRRVILRAIRHTRYTYEQIQQRRRQLLTAAWLLIFLGIFCAWASFGLMMRTGFLPIFDLGYSWFDHHITFFFDILPRAGKI